MKEEGDLKRYEHKSVKIFLENKYKYEGYILSIGEGFLNLLDAKTHDEIAIRINTIKFMQVIS
jgi:hypothetical protein